VVLPVGAHASVPAFALHPVVVTPWMFASASEPLALKQEASRVKGNRSNHSIIK